MTGIDGVLADEFTEVCHAASYYKFLQLKEYLGVSWSLSVFTSRMSSASASQAQYVVGTSRASTIYRECTKLKRKSRSFTRSVQRDCD